MEIQFFLPVEKCDATIIRIIRIISVNIFKCYSTKILKQLRSSYKIAEHLDCCSVSGQVMFTFFLFMSWFKSPFSTRIIRSGEIKYWSGDTVYDPVYLELLCSGAYPGGGKTILKLGSGYNTLSGRRTCRAWTSSSYCKPESQGLSQVPYQGQAQNSRSLTEVTLTVICFSTFTWGAEAALCLAHEMVLFVYRSQKATAKVFCCPSQMAGVVFVQPPSPGYSRKSRQQLPTQYASLETSLILHIFKPVQTGRSVFPHPCIL